ncbi:MAG: metallophosphoesterase [Verrucomicrobiota bacterium]
MKILFLADLHMNLRQLDWLESQAGSYDLVIIGGDLLQLADTRSKEEQISEIIPYLRRIAEQALLVVSSGNHDGNRLNAAEEEYADWIRCLPIDGLLVDGGCLDFKGYRFSCCAWWNGAESRGEMLKQLQSDKPKDDERWIWIHHSPPRGSRTAWTRKGNVGDPYLQKLIGRFKPSHVLCGHVHNAPFYADGAWCEKIGKTWVFNPGMQIGGVPCHISLDLSDKKASYESLEGRESVVLD